MIFCFYSAGDGEQGREMRTLIQVISISSISISCFSKNVEIVIVFVIVVKLQEVSVSA